VYLQHIAIHVRQGSSTQMMGDASLAHHTVVDATADIAPTAFYHLIDKDAVLKDAPHVIKMCAGPARTDGGSQVMDNALTALLAVHLAHQGSAKVATQVITSR